MLCTLIMQGFNASCSERFQRFLRLAQDKLEEQGGIYSKVHTTSAPAQLATHCAAKNLCNMLLLTCRGQTGHHMLLLMAIS